MGEELSSRWPGVAFGRPEYAAHVGDPPPPFAVDMYLAGAAGYRVDEAWRVIERELGPATRGILFDQPHVVEAGRAAMAEAELDGRCDVVGGDFFASVPAGADGYILSWIIHDWDDERALAILTNVRKAIAPDGRLLLFEAVVPEGDAPGFAKVIDAFLMPLGGVERTEAEFAALLAAAGFRLERHVPTLCPQSILEAVYADKLGAFDQAGYFADQKKSQAAVARSRTNCVRCRVRSRNSRTGAGGTKLGRSRPCCNSRAIQAASARSVLRPGTFLRCWALTSTSAQRPSSTWKTGFQ